MRPLLRSLLTRASPTRFLASRPYLARYLLTTGIFLTWIPTAAFFFNHIGRTYRIDGRSMYPFLNTDYQSTLQKDRIWLNQWNPWEGLRRGMIVAFWSPSRPEHIAVKRIIALEGDTVRTKSPYPYSEQKVPMGYVWVEGEHPDDSRSSNDSNTYGPLPVSLLVGKVTAVVWPWSKVGWVRWQDWKGSARVRDGTVEGDERIEIYTM